MKDFMEQQLWLAPRHFLILLLNSGGQLKNYSDCRFQWSLKVVCCAIRVKGKRFTEVKQEWELNKWCNFCIFKPWTVWAFIFTFFGLNRYIRVMFIAVIRDHEPFKDQPQCIIAVEKARRRIPKDCAVIPGITRQAERPQLFASPTFSVSPSQRDLTRTWLSRPRVPMGWTNIYFSHVYPLLLFAFPVLSADFEVG